MAIGLTHAHTAAIKARGTDHLPALCRYILRASSLPQQTSVGVNKRFMRTHSRGAILTMDTELLGLFGIFHIKLDESFYMLLCEGMRVNNNSFFILASLF